MKAIETVYNGYRFRSRLEARWAVFFDALGVKYEYEPEGFDLGNGMYYLPDFRVKCWGKRGQIWNEPFDLWIEVKGRMTQKDASKIRIFAGEWMIDETDEEGLEKRWNMENPILIVSQIPEKGRSDDCDWCDTSIYENGIDNTGVYPFNYELIDGDFFGAFPAALNGRFYLWGADNDYVHDMKIVEDAYEKARQVRFEYRNSEATNNYDSKKNTQNGYYKYFMKSCWRKFGFCSQKLRQTIFRTIFNDNDFEYAKELFGECADSHEFVDRLKENICD